MNDMKETPSFEEALGKLEEIVSRLESGDMLLEETISLFEEGMALAATCARSLDEAALKVRELLPGDSGFDDTGE